MVKYKKCTRCGEVLPLTDFSNNKWTKDGLQNRCKKCRSIVRREQYLQNREARIEDSKRWAQENPEKRREQVKRWREKNPEKRREYRYKHREKLRLLVLSRLSKGSLKCAKCDFSDIRALQIDHINGGGNKERKELGIRKYYNKLLALPDEELFKSYQVLCANCNAIKQREKEEYPRKYAPN